MKSIFRNALLVAGMAVTTQALAQITFYEREGFEGQTFTTDQRVWNFERHGFNDRASSVTVVGDRWEVCEDARFEGRCVVLRPGRYPSLAAMGLNNRISSTQILDRNARVDENRYAPLPVVIAPPVDNGPPLITFYERENFRGRTFETDRRIGNFERQGFNDRASSVIVTGGRWEVCEDIRFNGRCVVLRPGHYPSLAAMGLGNRVSSVRDIRRNERIDERRYAPVPVAVLAPAPVATYNYGRRHDEQLFEATVTSVRAVVGPPEHRCWIEREQTVQDRGNSSVGGAIAGTIIGGVLGHQVGSGHGKDAATALGAVTGAVVGANLGRDNGQQVVSQDVQHCRDVPSQARPEYWDVTYNFHNQEHRVQMTAPPGTTVTVNRDGEPRS